MIPNYEIENEFDIAAHSCCLAPNY